MFYETSSIQTLAFGKQNKSRFTVPRRNFSMVCWHKLTQLCFPLIFYQSYKLGLGPQNQIWDLLMLYSSRRQRIIGIESNLFFHFKRASIWSPAKKRPSIIFLSRKHPFGQLLSGFLHQIMPLSVILCMTNVALFILMQVLIYWSWYKIALMIWQENHSKN